MKIVLSTLLLGATLAGCHRATDAPAPEATPATLVGTWQLTGLQCDCPPNTPVPNEQLTFTSSQHFQYLRDGQLVAEGSYATGTGSACSQAAGTEPLLTLTPATAGTVVPGGNYTLSGGTTLVIDQCLAADGPRYTFKRQ